MTHYEILAMLARDCESYLEVGVQEGGSLTAVLESNPRIADGDILLCDTWDGRHGGTSRGNGDHAVDIVHKFRSCDMEPDGELIVLSGRSQHMLPGSETAYKKNHYELSHVDGGHDYDECYSDLVNVWYMTKKHMVVHDISFSQVWNAIYVWAKREGEVTAFVSRCFFEDQGSIVFSRVDSSHR